MHRRTFIAAAIASIGAPHAAPVFDLGAALRNTPAGQTILVPPGTYVVSGFRVVGAQCSDLSSTDTPYTRRAHFGQTNHRATLPGAVVSGLFSNSVPDGGTFQVVTSGLMSSVTSKVLSLGQQICFFMGAPANRAGVVEGLRSCHGMGRPPFIAGG